MSGTFPEALPVRVCLCMCFFVYVYAYALCVCTCILWCVCVCVCLNKPTLESSIIGPVSASLPTATCWRWETERHAVGHRAHTPVTHCPQRWPRRPLWCFPDGHVCLFPWERNLLKAPRESWKSHLWCGFIFFMSSGCHGVCSEERTWEGTSGDTTGATADKITRVKMPILYSKRMFSYVTIHCYYNEEGIDYYYGTKSISILQHRFYYAPEVFSLAGACHVDYWTSLCPSSLLPLPMRAERMSVVIWDKIARWTFPGLGTFSWCAASEQPLIAPPHNPKHFVLMLHSMKMREYGNVMAFEVNMYYKINLDEDLPIPLIRRGDWRLIFNCESNYMEQIASDIWLSRWLIKRPGCRGRLSASWIQTKEKIKKVVPFVITNFKGEITKPNIPSEEPSILPLCARLPSYLTPAVTTSTTPTTPRPRWLAKPLETMMWKMSWGVVLL